MMNNMNMAGMQPNMQPGMQPGVQMSQVMQQQQIQMQQAQNPMMTPQGQQILVQQQQQQQQQQQPQQSQEKLDNISKVKSLIGPLRESLSVTLKTAAHVFHQNSLVDIGTLKNVDLPPTRFDKSIEEFYSICDQIELHLKTSIECINQGASSQKYLNIPVTPTRTEPIPGHEMNALTYPQYLTTVKSQVAFANEIHDMLLHASQNITTTE